MQSHLRDLQLPSAILHPPHLRSIARSRSVAVGHSLRPDERASLRHVGWLRRPRQRFLYSLPGWEWKRLMGCVFSPPVLGGPKEARKRNLSIASIPLCLHKVCLKSPGTDVGAAGFGMGVPGILRQTLPSEQNATGATKRGHGTETSQVRMRDQADDRRIGTLEVARAAPAAAAKKKRQASRLHRSSERGTRSAYDAGRQDARGGEARAMNCIKKLLKLRFDSFGPHA